MNLPDTPTARRLGHRIVRWSKEKQKSGVSPYKYYVSCEIEGCDKEVNVTPVGKKYKNKFRCRLCSRLRGYLFDVPIYNNRIWNSRRKIKEMRLENGKNIPYIKCKKRNCSRTTKYWHPNYRSNGKRNGGFCAEHYSMARKKRVFEALFNKCKRSAKHEWKLTYKEFYNICAEKKCHYCKGNIIRTLYTVGTDPGNMGIDRKDTLVGYHYNNCVACCSECNFSKNAYLTYSEMTIIGALRAENRTKAQRILRSFPIKRNAQKSRLNFAAVRERVRIARAKSNARKK